MNVLIVTFRFYPFGDATSLVVYNTAKALIKIGFKVSVLSFTDKKEYTNIKEWNGISVINIYNPIITPFRQLTKSFFINSPFTYSLIMFIKLLNRFWGRIGPISKKLSLNPFIVSSYNRSIHQVVSSQNFDLCLVTLMPHETVYSVFNVLSKHKMNMDVVVLQYDTYWNNEFPEKNITERKTFEQHFIDKSLFVMTTPQIYEMNKHIFDNYESKVIPCEFPNITNKNISDDNDENENTKSNNIHCVFLGTLYKRIRPPQKIIEILEQFKGKNIVFDFYGREQHLISSLDSYKSISDFVILHGNVSSSKADKIQKKADVLVNIDNTNQTQVPSKIFDYMCTGKRIINFYFSEESPSLPYLKKYPSCFNINVNEKVDSDTLDSMVKFIMNQNYLNIPFSEIEVLFKENTPEFVVNQFLEMYKKQKELEKQK